MNMIWKVIFLIVIIIIIMSYQDDDKFPVMYQPYKYVFNKW